MSSTTPALAPRKAASWRSRAGDAAPYAFLLLMVILFFAVPPANGVEVTSFSVFNALQDFAALGLLALALGVTMIAGEFDLSVLGSYALGAMLAVKTGVDSPWLGVVVAVAACALVGLVQGLLIARLRLNSMAVTLGGYLTLLGVTAILGHNKSVPYTNLDAGARLDDPILDVFSLRSLVAIAFFAVVALAMRYTTVGRDLRAVGGDRRASRVVGVRVDRIVTGCFVFSGAVAGLAGALLGYSIATAVPDPGFSPLIFAITAALLGGLALSGGKGTALGIAAGALTLALLRQLFVMLASPDYVADLVTGGVLVAVTIVSAPQLLSWWRGVRSRAAAPPSAGAAPDGAGPAARPAGGASA